MNGCALVPDDKEQPVVYTPVVLLTAENDWVRSTVLATGSTCRAEDLERVAELFPMPEAGGSLRLVIPNTARARVMWRGETYERVVAAEKLIEMIGKLGGEAKAQTVFMQYVLMSGYNTINWEDDRDGNRRFTFSRVSVGANTLRTISF